MGWISPLGANATGRGSPACSHPKTLRGLRWTRDAAEGDGLESCVVRMLFSSVGLLHLASTVELASGVYYMPNPPGAKVGGTTASQGSPPLVSTQRNGKAERIGGLHKRSGE